MDISEKMITTYNTQAENQVHFFLHLPPSSFPQPASEKGELASVPSKQITSSRFSPLKAATCDIEPHHQHSKTFAPSNQRNNLSHRVCPMTKCTPFSAISPPKPSTTPSPLQSFSISTLQSWAAASITSETRSSRQRDVSASLPYHPPFEPPLSHLALSVFLDTPVSTASCVFSVSSSLRTSL